jgi:hypothetical protein
MRQGCPFSALLFNIILEFLDRAIKHEEEMKRIQIRKEVVKLFLFAGDMIFYLKDSTNFTKKLLDMIIRFSRVAGHKIIVHKSVAFLYMNNEEIEKE